MALNLGQRLSRLDTLSLRIIAPGAVALICLAVTSMLLHARVLDAAAERGAAEVAAFRVLPALRLLESTTDREGIVRALSGPDLELLLQPTPLVAAVGQKQVPAAIGEFGAVHEMRTALAPNSVGPNAVEEIHLSARLQDGVWLNARVRAVSLLSADDMTFRVASIAVAMCLLLLATLASRAAARPLVQLAERARQLPADGVIAVDGLKGPREVRDVADALHAATRRTHDLLLQRSQALGALSHDLMSPLTRLRLRLEDMPAGEPRHCMLRDVQDMLEMARDVLAYLRGGDGGGERRTALSLASLVQVVVDELRDQGHVIEEGKIGEATVIAQPAALRRALSNLLGNALRHGRNVRVDVDVDVEGSQAVVWVSDRGEGMSTEDLTHVFEPFFRGDRARAAGEGSGLGLPTAKAIIESHGGSLRLISEPGAGTQAIVALPMARGPREDTKKDADFSRSSLGCG